MNEKNERLSRRTAAYRRPPAAGAGTLQIARFLKQLQDDTAALATVDDAPLDLGPAFLRSRAAHYRELAGHQSDPHRAGIFRDLAASFERHAAVKERRPEPTEI